MNLPFKKRKINGIKNVRSWLKFIFFGSIYACDAAKSDRTIHFIQLLATNSPEQYIAGFSYQM
jgi:hypothetical protein